MRPCPRALVVAGGRFPPGRAEVTLVGLQVMPGQPIVAWVSTNQPTNQELRIKRVRRQ